MMPILITLLLTTPVLALGTWLYLRRRTFSPAVRLALLTAIFLFVLVSGPAIFWMWARCGVSTDIASTERGGRKLHGQIPLLWLLAVLGIGAQLFRLVRN